MTKPARALRTLIPFLLAGTLLAADDWPQWGGPTRDFHVRSTGLADTWPETGPPRLWERELGPGYSTIACRDGRLFTMYRRGDEDVIVALNASDGQTVWEHTYAAPVREGQTLEFGTGPNATPLLLPDRLVTVSFTGIVTCVALDDGKPLWSKDLVADLGGKVQNFGYSASPLLHEGKVIVLLGSEKAGTIGLDPRDGSVTWESEPHDISYASPIRIDVAGRPQFVVMSSEEVLGLDAASGRILWRQPCSNRYKNNASDPLWSAKDNLLWAATQLDGGCRVLRLQRADDTTTAEQVWFERNVRIFHWNAVNVDGTVYASIGGQTTLLSAVDLQTGKVHWKERGFHKALVLYADDRLILLDENGTLAMVRVSPEKCEVLAQTQLTEKVSWSAPTIVGRTLYVRDTKKLIALDLGRK